MNTEDNNDFYDDELSRSLISNDFEEDTPRKKKKSKKPLVICLIILLIAAVAGGIAWYMVQRHKPVEATEEFLTGMQNMDFTTMENLLQSHDLSALDDADIRDSAYTDFFTTVNKKMTYKITKNKFDIQNGTAKVTVHMKYIDGTNIYAATIQEYTRKVAVAAYAGKEMTQDDIQVKMQKMIQQVAEAEGKKLKPKQAVELRKMGKEITKEAVESVLAGKEQKKPQSVSVKLPVELYERYFGQMDAGAVQEIMEKALEGYFGKEAPGV